MKTYLITGGAGFIGSNHILYLFEKYGSDIKIINVDCLTYAGKLENLESINKFSNYEFIKANICDKAAIEAIFENNHIDYVVHFAAESHVDRSIKNPEIFVETNVLGTATLLNICNKYWKTQSGYKQGKKFIQISTDEVYGSLGATGYFTEATPLDARSPYSASKAAADMLVSSYWHTYKMPINITRCSNNYGPFQFPEKLIPLIITNALNGKLLPVYGDGKNVRDWLYVKDHAKAVDLVTQNGKVGDIYNIGGHNEKENIEIVKLIIDILNDMLPINDARKEKMNYDLIEYVKDRAGHDRRYAIDPTKIRTDLGWQPEIMFDEGIKATIKWYLNELGGDKY